MIKIGNAAKALELHCDGIKQKASAVRAKTQSTRQRVCLGCVLPEDQALGLVHSELPCQRCGKKPCHGIVTTGDQDMRLDP